MQECYHFGRKKSDLSVFHANRRKPMCLTKENVCVIIATYLIRTFLRYDSAGLHKNGGNTLKTLFKQILCMALILATLCGSGIFSITVSAEAEDQAALNYYVAPDGSDSNDGKSLDKPFATIERARDAIRALRAANKLPDGGITVYIRGGIYSYLDESLTFTSEDSGTESCPITYKAYEGEKVVIEGAKFLNYSDFKKADSEVTSRLISEEAQEKLLQINLKDAGIQGSEVAAVYGNLPVQLLIGDDRGVVARYPNQVDGFISGGGGREFYDNTGRMDKWQTTDYTFIRGYYSIDYACSTCKITSYDPEEGLMTTDDEVKMGTHFYYLNVLEEIDYPGEYYIDFRTTNLYVYPTDDFATTPISVTQQKGDMIVGKDVDYVTLDGLTIEGGLGCGIKWTGNNVTIQNCELYKLGYAIDLMGVNCTVAYCDAAYLYGSGIHIEAPSDADMTGGFGKVMYCKIHHYAQSNDTYNPGIQCSGEGVEMYIGHNEISHSVHNAMLANGSQMLVEYNIMHDVCTEANDAGAMYTGGWNAYNVVFRYNLVYNVENIWGFGGPNAFYVDDGGSGKVFYGNILYNVGGDAFAIGGGHDNQIYNNLMINVYKPINYDTRQYYNDWESEWSRFPSGYSWVAAMEYVGFCSRKWCTWFPTATMTDRSNVVNTDSPWVAGSFGMARYRGNIEINCDYSANIYGTVRKFATVRDNIVYKKIDGLMIGDVENLDFSVSPESRIYYDLPGFRPIPLDQIGTGR